MFALAQKLGWREIRGLHMWRSTNKRQSPPPGFGRVTPLIDFSSSLRLVIILSLITCLSAASLADTDKAFISSGEFSLSHDAETYSSASWDKTYGRQPMEDEERLKTISKKSKTLAETKTRTMHIFAVMLFINRFELPLAFKATWHYECKCISRCEFKENPFGDRQANLTRQRIFFSTPIFDFRNIGYLYFDFLKMCGTHFWTIIRGVPKFFHRNFGHP
jgi:hypothetical protein